MAEDTVEISFKLTRDYIALQNRLSVEELYNSCSPWQIFNCFLMPVIFGCVFVFFDDFLIFFFHNVSVKDANIISWGVTTFVIFVFIFRGVNYSAIAKKILKKKKNLPEQEHVLRIDSKFISVKNEEFDTIVNWKSVEKVFKQDNFICIIYYGYVALLIPLTSFKERKDFDMCFELCKDHHNKNNWRKGYEKRKLSMAK